MGDFEIRSEVSWLLLWNFMFFQDYEGYSPQISPPGEAECAYTKKVCSFIRDQTGWLLIILGC